MTTRRAAIYCRISQDREGAGLGIERQRQDCEDLAKRLGWTVVEQQTDNDVSAYSGRPRPGYLTLLDSIREGRVDAVLAWHEDRLHRSPRELEDYIDVCEPGAVVTHFAQAGELDLATASGRMTARIRGAVSRQESEHKSERTRRAQRQAAEAGKWLGGSRPFGWTLDETGGGATLNRAEAHEIREAAKSLLAGASLGSLVADLNTRGVTTSTGRQWSYTSLRQAITRPRNAGLSVYNGEVMGATTWPAIFTEDTWRAVCSLLTDPSRRRSTSNRVRWLLAGIALCGKCGAPLKSATVASNRAKGTTRTVYRCPTPGTGHVARAAGPLDEHIQAVTLARLARPDLAEAFATDERAPDTEGLRLEAVSIRAQQGEAADLFTEDAITGAQLAKITRGLSLRLDGVEAAMARAARVGVLNAFIGRDPAEVWADLDIDRRRAVVRELMTVNVLPSGRRGNTYDPEFVQVGWRVEQ